MWISRRISAGRGDDVQLRFTHLPVERVAVLEHVDLRGRRRDAFLRDRAADERVDERALAGVEFADDDEQEELVELLDRAVERLLVFGRSIETRERRAEPREHASLLADQLILGAGQNPGQHRVVRVHYPSQWSRATGYWRLVRTESVLRNWKLETGRTADLASGFAISDE